MVLATPTPKIFNPMAITKPFGGPYCRRGWRNHLNPNLLMHPSKASGAADPKPLALNPKPCEFRVLGAIEEPVLLIPKLRSLATCKLL